MEKCNEPDSREFNISMMLNLFRRGIFRRAGNIYFVDICLSVDDFREVILSVIQNHAILTVKLKSALANHMNSCGACLDLFLALHNRIMEFSQKQLKGEIKVASHSELIILASNSAEEEICSKKNYI